MNGKLAAEEREAGGRSAGLGAQTLGRSLVRRSQAAAAFRSSVPAVAARSTT